MTGRQCRVCASGAEVRREVDGMIINGSSFRAIAHRYEFDLGPGAGISRDSVRRHFLSHASTDVRNSLAESAEVSAASLVGQIHDIAEDARDLRVELQAAGKTRESLRAADSELRALTTLVVRLGITDADLIAAVKETEDLAFALVGLVQEHPELVVLLVEALRDRGADALADAYLQVSKKELTK